MACIFYLLSTNKCIIIDFYTIAIFLAGDWEITDFTPIGNVLSVGLSIFGVAIFAVPVSVLFEAFQEGIKENEKVCNE
jgi:hypothetical protein